MSAFIVEPKTIARALFPLTNTRRDDWAIKEERTLVAAALHMSQDDPDLINRLAYEMQELNRKGVNERYGENEPVNPVKIRPEPTHLLWSYKALRCWLYQCAEGDIPETSKLYQAMEQVSLLMCQEIVQQMPSYDAAPWG